MRSCLLVTLAVLVGCAPAAEGLRRTPDGDGPVITIDWDAHPLPELPYPNDLSTIADPTSPTGLRLNVPTETLTEYEHETRMKLNTLTGFGVYQPITVGFRCPATSRNDDSSFSLYFVPSLKTCPISMPWLWCANIPPRRSLPTTCSRLTAPRRC